MAKKTIELELEIQSCSHMIFNPEKLKKPFKIYLGTDNDKVNIGNILLQSEKDIICNHTKKPCVLYTQDYGVTFWPHIVYSLLERCPSSEESVIKYKLKGKKSRNLYLHVSEIERIEE